MLIFRKVCNFNLFKTNSTYFPQILYLTGNFMNQLSAKFLLKKLSEIAKFENSRNRFDNFWFNSIQIYQNIRSSHREVVCIKRSSTKSRSSAQISILLKTFLQSNFKPKIRFAVYFSKCQYMLVYFCSSLQVQ